MGVRRAVGTGRQLKVAAAKSVGSKRVDSRACDVKRLCVQRQVAAARLSSWKYWAVPLAASSQ